MSCLRGRTALQMEAEQSHMTEMIFNLALEIIYMLTGEKYAAVKMASIEGLLGGLYPPLSVGGSTSQTPIMKPTSHSRISESNNQKILEVTNKIVELLAGEVSDVCSFKEERSNVEKDHFMVTIMDNQAWVTPADGSSEGNPPERSPHSSYSRDSAQEDQEIPHRHQVVDEKRIKKEVKEEAEVAYVRGDERRLEEETSPELPMGSSQEGYSSSHHDQEGEAVGSTQYIFIKEEEEDEWDEEQHEEEEMDDEISPHKSADWWFARGDQEHHQVVYSDGGIQTTDDITANSSNDDTILNLHPANCRCSECLAAREKLSSQGGRNSFSQSSLNVNEKTDFARYFSHLSSLMGNEEIHKVYKPFTCSECGKGFSQLSHLKVHLKTHTGEKPYSCSECGKRFTRLYSLTLHKRSHTGEKPYTCHECGKCFSRLSYLTEHEKSHKGEKPYLCTECGKCFSLQTHLTRHRKCHTKQKQNATSDEVSNHVLSDTT